MEGFFFAAAALLVVSGIKKLLDPAPTAGVLRAANVPYQGVAVIGLGALEVLVGVSNLTVSSSLLVWAQAALYGGFGFFMAWALRKSVPLASCGCFGKPDTPPTPIHVLVNLAAMAGATIQALAGAPSLGSIVSAQPFAGVLYLGFVVIGTYCLYLLLAELPLLRTRA